MQSMTWGTLPTREDFDTAFEAECPDGYNISLNRTDSRAVDGFKLGDGVWTADQLWTAINEIVDAYNASNRNDENMERAADLVSSILFTLNFEWI